MPLSGFANNINVKGERQSIVVRKLMKELSKMTKDELLELKSDLDKEYESVKAKRIQA